MDLQGNRTYLFVAALAALLVIGLFRMFSDSPDVKNSEAQEISYEMPRPKSELVGEFGLGHREIDRRYVNPFETKNKAAAIEAAKAAAPGKASAAKKKSEKKKSADKKKKTETEVRIADTSRDSGFGPDRHAESAFEPASPLPERRTAADPGVEAADQKEDLLSPAQWRALMSAQPTAENMNKFTEAYARAEVDDATFYAVIEEYLKSQDDQRLSLALQGLGNARTLKSFTFIVRIAPTLQDEKAQNQLAAHLKSYAAPSSHAVLLRALETGEQDLTLAAAGVVLEGLQITWQGDPRQARDGVRMMSWSHFTPAVQRLTGSEDENLRNIASNILSLLSQAST